MLRRVIPQPARSPSAAAPARGLATSPRLSRARQRRLDELLRKAQDGSLTKNESAELEGMLDEIDRKSFWMLARALAEKRNAGSTATRHKRGIGLH